MEVKEILTHRVIVERFRSVLEKIKQESQENFTDPLFIRVDGETLKNATLIFLDKIKETEVRRLGIFVTTKKDEKILAWLIVKDDKIICGVSDPVLYLLAKEKITKMYATLEKETFLKELLFKIDFEEVLDKMVK